MHALAFSVIGQCLHYKMARAITERLVGPAGMEALDLEYLTEHITTFCLAALGRRAPARCGGLRSVGATGGRRRRIRERGLIAMGWIALKMLVGDRAKFLGIVLGLTFAALLITQQGSIFCGLMLRTCGQVTDITGADLWVMDPTVRYIDDVKPMLENSLYRVRGRRGGAVGRPALQGAGPGEDQSRRRPGQPGDGHRAGDPAGPGRRHPGRGAAASTGCSPGNLRDLRLPDAIMVDGDRLSEALPRREDWDDLPTARARRSIAGSSGGSSR